MRRAYIDCLALQHIRVICGSKLRTSVNVTTRTFRLDTLVNPGVTSGTMSCHVRPLNRLITISKVFFLFSFRLQVSAHWDTWASSFATVALFGEDTSR